RATGAANLAPYPPCSTTTANAILLSAGASYGANPANHECGSPGSNCAPPGFPATLTSMPLMAVLAVPPVTTDRIAFARKIAESGATSATGAEVRELLASITHRPCGMNPPAAIVAATRAILNG